MSSGRERSVSLLILCATALFLFLLALPMLRGSTYTFDDLGGFHLPLRALYQDSLTHGESFIWNSRLLAGFYAHGEGQVGMYHPLHLLLYSALPLVTAFNVEFLASYPFMFAGMFLLGRRWGLRQDAALFGAFVFTFSGFNLLHHVHMNAIAIVAHLPWCLWAIDGIIRPSDRRHAMRAGVALAVLTTSQLLLGYPQYLWFSGLIESLYVVFSGVSWRTLPSLVFYKTVGLIGGAVQLLPTWVSLQNSVRDDPSVSFRNSYALDPLNLWQLVAPYGFQDRVIGVNIHEYGIYNGALATLTFVLLLVHRRTLADRRAIVDWALVVGVLGLVLAVGDRGYLYRLQRFLPLVGGFRAPARSILLFHFASGVAAALVFHTLSLAPDIRGRAALRLWPLLDVWLLSAIVAAGFAGLPIWPGSYLAPHADDLWHVAAGPLLIAAGAACLAAGRRWGAPVTALIVLFAVADQAAYGLRNVWASQMKTDAFLERAVLPPDPAERVLSDNNELAMKGARLADGYVGLRPRRVLPAESLTFRQLAGVGWIGLPTGKYVRSPGAMPRTWLVARTVRSDDVAGEIGRLDLASTAIVGGELQLPGGEPGNARMAQDSPGTLTVVTNAPSKQLLIVSESYHAGWRATIDGTPAPAIRVDGDFLGCVVEPGRHAVRFTFDPVDLRLGKWLTASAVAIMLGCLGLSFRPPRRNAGPQASIPPR